jgi:hypothetical protein
MRARRFLAIAWCTAVAAGALPLEALAARPAGGIPIELAIVDSDGTPLAGQTVALAVLPTGESQPADIPMGQRTTSGGTGRAAWRVHLTPSQRSAVRANGDWLNLQAAALGGDDSPTAFVGFSLYLGSEKSQLAESRSRPKPNLTVRRDTKPAGMTRQRAAAGQSGAGTSCHNYHWKLASTSVQWTETGQLHVSGDTTKAQFTYGRTADTDISAAYRVAGGAWSLSGSTHVGNSLTSASTKTASSFYYRHELSQFQYGLWKLYADCYEGEIYQNQDHTEVLMWIGGGLDGTTSISYWDNRSHANYYFYDFGPNWDYTRSTSSLSGIDAAVSVFGATLKSQSGASSYVKYYYLFGSQAHHYLYGLTRYPNQAGVIYASDF